MATSEFARWLTDQMQQRDFSQSEAAAAWGIDQSVLSRILRGERRPGEQTLQTLAAMVPWDEQDLRAKAGFLSVPPEALEFTRLQIRLDGVPEPMRRWYVALFHLILDGVFQFGGETAPKSDDTDDPLPP